MASGFNDDDFDWEAAVAEIDAACIRAEAAIPLAEKAGGSRNSIHQMGQPCHGSQSNQAKTFQQKTLDFFLADAGRKVGKLKLASDKNRGPSECAVFETGSDGGVSADLSVIRTWIYPANVPHRDYQFAITKTALFSNTLVSLPTGLGKTLIAAVVMYNYFRWFPLGKIVFTAPSRPLVVQQIEACHKIVGIPQDMTIDMTGQMNPGMRAENWQSRRVFFVTPQVLEKDIQSGTCTVKQIVCLVVDEAHRATGNYSYCVVVRELLAAKVQFRILALTATPGSKQITVQTVVDNLQISCLEYRDENDSDVSRYTHSRKLEVVEVAMNTESNNIKDLFLEVLQPIVYKLCQLGVFYSKDIGRVKYTSNIGNCQGCSLPKLIQYCEQHEFQLTPYEFLTARGKFREAPPQNLEQSRYGEVETNFGVAITLYHVFKLLFSHGIRPAYEMLQQKLQQGILRKMGCSDKLRQIQSMMKESVGHGAPSPKLAKVVEIILDHFSLHDGATTRVIIFTNFRESVKDIMETLTALGTTVKPMEFIGQSSGKASKGQTQKIQQAVLQKFRAGGYNTIVATSIAEEGLDIMEVDLVICFDANISPLRMIQRMGRTGRKRDGRVVVLASEGAELQGYLKKQAKSKAMGKHMDHGGIHSFDFHPSPRMIPHKFHPEVQLVELAIEEFVPRGRKLKPQESAIRLRDFNEDELQILQKYRNPPGAEAWKPSLIAFPRYQLLPTPVYQVKHSFRTTSMLIGALQRVQEAVYLGKEKLSNDFKIAIAQDQVYLTNDQVRFPTSQSERSPDIDNQTFGQVDIEDNILELRCSPGLESCKEHRDLVSCSSSTTYQPKYSLGIVSVSSSGDLYIASPPLLTTITEDSIFGNPADVHYESPSANEMLQAQQICNNQISTHETYNLNPLFPPANMECTVVDGVVEAQDVVSETQYTITPPVAVKSKVTFTKSKLLCANPDDSPRLSEFACRGVVPASPVPCISENKVHVPFDSGLAFSGARPLKHVIVEHDNSSPRTPVSAVPPIIETAEKSFKGLDCQSRYTVLAPQATSPPQPRTLEFSEPEPISSSSLQKVEQLEVNSLSIESANRKKCQGLEPVSSIVENLPKIQTSTPSAKTSISNSQDWQLHPEVSASAQRPHKLRRLRKAHDKQAMGSSEFQAVSVCSSGHVGLKVKPQQLKSKLGRHQRKFAVQAFVDLEAE